MPGARLLARSIPLALLIAPLGFLPAGQAPTAVSAATTAAIAALTAQGKPILDVPRSMMQAPAVKILIEMKSPAQALLTQSPALETLLSTLRGSLLDALHVAHATGVYAYHLVPIVAATTPGASIPLLLAQRGVASITLDRVHPLLPAHTQADAAIASVAASTSLTGPVRPVVDAAQTIEPESYALTRADVAAANGYTGAGVRVAIIDSGLDLSQPDLSVIAARDAAGAPLRVDYTGYGYADTVGHGTACASMIAAQGHEVYRGDNKDLLQVYPQVGTRSTLYKSSFTVKGMAPGVTVMSAKIFDTRSPNEGGYDSWIVRAIEWSVDHHANVISESFGGLSVPSDGTDPTAAADEAAVKAGVVVVAADGNEGPGETTISSPANAPGVIGVGASTDFRSFGQTGFLATYGATTADNIASFTSRGPTTDGRARPDLVAPGAFAWALFPLSKSADGATKPPYDVGQFGGTSQATPVTAGAAALVIEAFRRAHNGSGPSPAVVRSILMSSAQDLGYPASDQGAGRLDAWRAVQTALRNAPSYLVGPNSIAVSGQVSSSFTTGFAVTNTGTTPTRYSFNATASHQTAVQEWQGSVTGTELRPYHFTVAPGTERVVGAVFWDSSSRYTIEGASKEVAMRVSLYDPRGRFVNYSYGVGSGYASSQAGKPLPGVWTVVVSENGRKNSEGVRQYTHENFQARVNTFMSLPFGVMTPRTATIAPGASTRVTLTGNTPAQAGDKVVTIHVIGDHTSAIPVALTSYITLGAGGGLFNGSFTGASNAYFSLANENKVYALDVPKGTQSLSVDLRWPNQGYGVLLLLVDPSGEIVDGQFNGIRSSGGSSPYDLSLHALEALWSNPRAGRWQIIVMDSIFSGRQRSEVFTGHVRFNDAPVTPSTYIATALPGGTTSVALSVRNNNGPNIAEGYIGYAVTNGYSYIPLGVIRGPFGPPKTSGTSIYNYATGFVPPGTRMIESSFAATSPDVPIDVSFADPIGFSRAIGTPSTLTIDGHSYKGSMAVVEGDGLPLGAWNGSITLSRPLDAGTHTKIVGTSVAYARTPLSWVTFDHGLRNGQITGGQPLILLPGQTDQLRASITVPLQTKPGLYHATLYVYTVYGDQVAKEPLTIDVVTHTGVEKG